MNYVNITKYNIICSVIGAAVHFTSHAYVDLESRIRSEVQARYRTTVQALALPLGLTHPVPPPLRLSIPEIIYEEAMAARVNPTLALALAQTESNLDPLAISRVGAIGLFQVMPFHAKDCPEGKKCLLDPRKNARLGLRVLNHAIDANNGNLDHALQEYNGGKRCINTCQESIAHSRKVLSKFTRLSPAAFTREADTTIVS